MRSAVRRICLALFIALSLMSVSAQTGTHASVLQIVAVVPPVLKLSLDFSQGSTTNLVGVIPSGDASASQLPANEGSSFVIRAGARINVGNARLFSNIKSSYTISVVSANGGELRDPAGNPGSGIGYELSLGDMPARASGNTFSFLASGKSVRGGTAMSVALNIPQVPAGASSGVYSDQITFSIAAN